MNSKSEKIAHFDRMASERGRWRAKNRYYYDELEGFLCQLVPPHRRVLEIGCGTGELLAKLAPSRGIGLDFSALMIAEANQNHSRADHPNLEFRVGDAEALDIQERFDYVVLSDVIGELSDVWRAFRELRRVTSDSSRVVITYFNALWEPMLRVGESLGLKMPQDLQNWLRLDDISNLLSLNGFEVVKQGYRLPAPKRLPGLSMILNDYLGQLPLVNRLGLVSYLVARRRPSGEARRSRPGGLARPEPEPGPAVSVVVPCRNERDNIRDAVQRIPSMGSRLEILFVDGNSTDGTVEAIEAEIKRQGLASNAPPGDSGPPPQVDIKLIHQLPAGSTEGLDHGRMLKLGKGDAVRKGFEAASGEVLMILDADLTVPPEELPRFYHALVEGHGELIIGTRLVYPMEDEAMRSLNKIANSFFGWLFSWLLNQRIKDTLCGTKALYRRDYQHIADGRAYFGDFDPFGDFDLLFGAARQNLKIVEVPVRYRRRTYGDVKIERFKHGLILLRMSLTAMRKLKFQ